MIILFMIVNTQVAPVQMEFSSMQLCQQAASELKTKWKEQYRSNIFAECILK